METQTPCGNKSHSKRSKEDSISSEESIKRRKKSKKDRKRKCSSSSDITENELSKSKRKKKCKKRHKHNKEKLPKREKSKDKSKDGKDKHNEKSKHKEERTLVGPKIPEVLEKSKSMAPMSKEEWEKRQNVTRRVFDEDTGRTRLIKGDGEILEEIVSRERHQEINRQATIADGNFFQSKLKAWVKK